MWSRSSRLTSTRTPAKGSSLTMREMLAGIGRVTLQLSNLCPWADKHPKCPVGRYEQKQILPGGVVMDVLECLSRDWKEDKQILAWHTYNEPLADPRLVWFMEEAKLLLPNAVQLVWTNGWNLTPGLALELVDHGMGWLVISNHGAVKGSFNEIAKVVADRGCRFGLTLHPHDGRAEWDDPDLASETACFALRTDLLIRASGHIGLCCMDCWEKQQFASVVDLGFREAMEQSWPERLRLRKELLAGKKTLEVCKNCQQCRRGKYA